MEAFFAGGGVSLRASAHQIEVPILVRAIIDLAGK